MSKLSVKMISIDFYPGLGGAQTHILRLSRFLQAHEVDVEVITRHYPGRKFQETVQGISVWRVPIWNPTKVTASLSFTLNSFRRLIATRREYQILHSHEMLSPMTIGLSSASLLSKKLVINPHRGGYLGDVYKLTKTRPMTGLARLEWAKRRGDAFIAISNEISSELISIGVPKEKIVLIPTAVDTNHFKPVGTKRRLELRAQLGLDRGIWVLFTGRLVEEKGLDVLLRAWHQVVKHNLNAYLLLVGDGEQRTSLENLARELELHQIVRFIGTVPDTAPYLQACDVYVQPSFTEGLPISLIEAMACSLPVVATSVGGVTDLVRDAHNGLVVAPHDVDGLRNHLLDLLTNENKRKSLGEQARQDVVPYCSIEQVGRAHLELYNKLLINP